MVTVRKPMKTILSLMLIFSNAWVQRAMSQDLDVERTLIGAQALYQKAHYKDSVDYLLPVDAMLREQPGRVGQAISVKMQLALGYVGQNQLNEAKLLFQEVCILDPEYKLEPTQFAPKVLALYDEVKTERKRAKCEALCGEINRLSKSGDAEGLLALTKDLGDGCICHATTEAAEVLFKQGVAAYKQEKFAQALEKLRGALKFRPEHDLAMEYADLTETKMDFTVELVPLNWRKHFDAHEFSQATSAYRQLESLNTGKANVALKQIGEEYRKAVISKVASWNQSCSTRTSVALDALRQEAGELLPNPTLASDVLSGLVPCVREAEADSPSAGASAKERSGPAGPAVQGCLQVESQLAMTRLKTRVSPDIPPSILPIGSIDMRVKVRIDEDGNVAVKGVEGSNVYINEAMRVSVEKWKFIPALADDQRRCVETEIPVVLTRS